MASLSFDMEDEGQDEKDGAVSPSPKKKAKKAEPPVATVSEPDA